MERNSLRAKLLLVFYKQLDVYSETTIDFSAIKPFSKFIDFLSFFYIFDRKHVKFNKS